MKRIVLMVFILASLVVSIAACSGNGGKTNLGDETYTVKVLYYDEQQFFREYGDLLYAKYPNIEIEVVNLQSLYSMNRDPDFDRNKAFIDFIDEKKPDVLMLSPEQYKQLYEEGTLLDLEPLIKADDYDIESIIPGVIDLLKEQAKGKLHGLATRFYSSALYYNISLFDKYGIEHPKDNMSWEEILQLARRFPADGSEEDRIYGLGGQEYLQYSQLLQMISATEGLLYVDPFAKKMTINNDKWKHIFSMIVEAYHSGAIPLANDQQMPMQGTTYEDFLLRNKFVVGKVAMTIDGSQLLDQLKQVRERMPDREPVDYALVTAPVDPNNREAGGQMRVHEIFSIHSSSEQIEPAWEIVKYINSEEMARIKSRSTAELLTRSTYMVERDGKSIEAFYKLKPITTNLYEGFENLPNAFNMQFYSLLNEQLKAVVEEGKPIDEVLEKLDTEGQKLLMQVDPEPAIIQK